MCHCSWSSLIFYKHIFRGSSSGILAAFPTQIPRQYILHISACFSMRYKAYTFLRNWFYHFYLRPGEYLGNSKSQHYHWIDITWLLSKRLYCENANNLKSELNDVNALLYWFHTWNFRQNNIIYFSTSSYKYIRNHQNAIWYKYTTHTSSNTVRLWYLVCKHYYTLYIFKKSYENMMMQVFFSILQCSKKVKGQSENFT